MRPTGCAGPQLAHDPAHVAGDALLVRGVVSDALIVDPFVDDRALVCGSCVARRRRRNEAEQHREKYEAETHARDSSGPPTPRQGNLKRTGLLHDTRRFAPVA